MKAGGVMRAGIAVAGFFSLATVSGCSTAASLSDEFAAYGYLSPGPDGEGEFIGSYGSRSACRAAADAWASRQVVGNPVHAECYPVDKQ